MTVCIAAQFKLGRPYVDRPMPAFILCTDGRLSEGEWGSNDAAIKTHTLGHNFMALMAGHWSTVRDLCSDLEQNLQRKSQPKTKADVVSIIKASVSKFCATDLCPDGVRCECIITGFVAEIPIMLSVTVDNKTPLINVRHDTFAIGEGAFLSDALMKVRGYDPLNVDLPVACYLTYEAKRFSESVDSVGPKTWLKVHLPVQKPGRGRRRKTTAVMDINEQGLKDLEEWRTECFLRPISAIKGRPFRRFR